MPDPSTEVRTGSLRLFVAIELPGEVREALGRLQHELQRRGLEKLRWVRPEGIHLTLRFLGETPTEKVAAISEAIRGAAGLVHPIELAFSGVGTFGRGEQAYVRVIYQRLVGATPDDMSRLRLLHRQIEHGLKRVGYPAEGRDFYPHLTLARVKQGMEREMAQPVANARNAVSQPEAAIPVREVSLMRSTLRPSGAVYERVAAFPLGGA